MFALIVCTNFIRLIFIAAIDYKNIFTMKISRSTVYMHEHIMIAQEEVDKSHINLKVIYQPTSYISTSKWGTRACKEI